ncbi:MAG TPA: hypothetical protein DIT99_07755, partial [Candidatus Latescibacteria bacterium]|nr:hypothetical protein [Candidatus Latescibacterota bacterium]
MSPEQIDQTAKLLVNARRQHQKIRLPDTCRPKNEDEAYAIQQAVTDRLTLPLIGWKIGAASKAVAAAEGAAQAASGRLFTPHVRRSPAIMGDHL